MSRRSSIAKKIKTEPVDDVEIFEVETILDKRIILGKVCKLKIHTQISRTVRLVAKHYMFHVSLIDESSSRLTLYFQYILIFSHNI